MSFELARSFFDLCQKNNQFHPCFLISHTFLKDNPQIDSSKIPLIKYNLKELPFLLKEFDLVINSDFFGHSVSELAQIPTIELAHSRISRSHHRTTQKHSFIIAPLRDTDAADPNDLVQACCFFSTPNTE